MSPPSKRSVPRIRPKYSCHTIACHPSSETQIRPYTSKRCLWTSLLVNWEWWLSRAVTGHSMTKSSTSIAVQFLGFTAISIRCSSEPTDIERIQNQVGSILSVSLYRCNTLPFSFQLSLGSVHVDFISGRLNTCQCNPSRLNTVVILPVDLSIKQHCPALQWVKCRPLPVLIPWSYVLLENCPLLYNVPPSFQPAAAAFFSLSGSLSLTGDIPALSSIILDLIIGQVDDIYAVNLKLTWTLDNVSFSFLDNVSFAFLDQYRQILLPTKIDLLFSTIAGSSYHYSLVCSDTMSSACSFQTIMACYLHHVKLASPSSTVWPALSDTLEATFVQEHRHNPLSI